MFDPNLLVSPLSTFRFRTPTWRKTYLLAHAEWLGEPHFQIITSRSGGRRSGPNSTRLEMTPVNEAHGVGWLDQGLGFMLQTVTQVVDERLEFQPRLRAGEVLKQGACLKLLPEAGPLQPLPLGRLKLFAQQQLE